MRICRSTHIAWAVAGAPSGSIAQHPVRCGLPCRFRIAEFRSNDYDRRACSHWRTRRLHGENGADRRIEVKGELPSVRCGAVGGWRGVGRSIFAPDWGLSGVHPARLFCSGKSCCPVRRSKDRYSRQPLYHGNDITSLAKRRTDEVVASKAPRFPARTARASRKRYAGGEKSPIS